MMKYEVTASQLNVRRVIPMSFEDESSIAAKVFSGFQFDGEEVPLEQIPNPALGRWYRDVDGFFYWGGGLSSVSGIISDIETQIAPWMLDLKIPEIWNTVTGKGVGIAVIDTGIVNGNPELPFNNNQSFIYDGGQTIEDKIGHGTHCAGLACARNASNHKIGIAFNAELFIGKIADTKGLKEEETIRFAKVINWCALQPNIHVISISWASFIRSQDTIDAIQAAINLAVRNNKIVVCAMGNSSTQNDPGPKYPASLKNTIGVGSIPKVGGLYPFFNEHLTTCLPAENILSYGLNGELIKESGTSQSNAILAGIIALMIEKNNFIYTPAQIKEALLVSSVLKTFDEMKLPVLSGELLLNYFK